MVPHSGFYGVCGSPNLYHRLILILHNSELKLVRLGTTLDEQRPCEQGTGSDNLGSSFLKGNTVKC